MTILASLLAISGTALAGEIRPRLLEVMGSADHDQLIPVTIILAEQVSRQEIEAAAAEHRNRDDRRQVIGARLKQQALTGQAALLKQLRRSELTGQVARIRTLWLSSVVAAELTPDLIESIGAREDVAWINHNPKQDVFEAVKAAVDAPATCGNEQIGAPQVWNDMGVTGQGVVIAHIDTGVCYFHPDIVHQIWVNPGEDLDGDGRVMDPDDENGIDDDGNGFVDDLIGWAFDSDDNDPVEYGSHGSHTAGTLAGDGSSGVQAGTAPGAQVMVLRAGPDAADEMDVWLGMEYAVDNGADLISLSMGWAPRHNPDRGTWRTNCDNTIDMGVTMVTSAGNEGGDDPPNDVTTPADVPRMISVGATDCEDALGSFSSIGPVSWQDIAPYNDHPYPPGLIKPDVTAPGVDTNSHRICNGYWELDGTSMAAPHVSGIIAMMLETDPTLDPATIKDLLESTAVDLGAPGKDNEFGSGRVDAVAAVSAVASRLRYASHTFDDSDPQHGNGDGDLDVGETVFLEVTLTNEGDSTATGVRARVSTASPGVEIINPVAYYPDLAAGSSAASNGSPFSLRMNQGCGQIVRLSIEIDRAEGPTSYSGFSFAVGVKEDLLFFEDDMETDKGWTASGDEPLNGFVREDPHEVNYLGQIIQPEDDATPAPGVTAYVTGNPPTGGGFNGEDGDVDEMAILDSPVFDASLAREGLTAEVSRWFYRQNLGFGDISRGELLMSDDGGASHSFLIRDNATTAGWEVYNAIIPNRPTSQMQLRVTAEELWIGGVPPTGDAIVEMLVDDVRFTGFRYLCDEFTAGAALAPNSVGNTLVLSPEYGQVRLSWSEPAVDVGHDPASLYQVYSSSSPDQGFTTDHETTATHHVDSRETAAGDADYFSVGGSNTGGSSGEEPAP